MVQNRRIRRENHGVDQAYVQSSISEYVYSSLSVLVLSTVLALCKVLLTQTLATVVVLWMHEGDTDKPVRVWVIGVAVQDVGYLAFLLGVKLRYATRETTGLVLKEPWWVVVLDKVFTL